MQDQDIPLEGEKPEEATLKQPIDQKTPNSDESTLDKSQETTKEEEKKMPELEPIIAWKAPSTIHHEKGRMWYVIAGVLTLLVIVYFILTDSASGAIAVLLLAGVYFLATNVHPRTIKVEINELGIKVDDKSYAFSGLRFFWIVYNPPITTTLNFALLGRLGKIITIQLGNQDPAEIRNFLRTQIPEVEGKKEGIFSALGKVLRI